MSRGPVVRGSTAANKLIRIEDTNGDGITTLDHNSAIDIKFRRSDQATWTTITKVAGTIGSVVSSGFVHDEDALYQLGLPADAQASGEWVVVKWSGAGIRTDQMEVQIHRFDHQSTEIKDMLEADAVVDTTTDPNQWKVSIRKRGTATVLLTKDLKDINGSPLTSISTVVGRQVQA